MPRLGFRKSRGGCAKCKQRRVKCDEQAPCAACRKHNVECSLSRSPNSMTSASSPTRRWVAEPSNHVEQGSLAGDRAATPQFDTFSFFGDLNDKQQFQDADSQWLADLGVMHHFTAMTWRTLPAGADRQEIWQLALPKLALTHDYLMHQVLALAASHMAISSPHDCGLYALQASQHQDLSIQGLRKVVADINDVNCHAVFATSSLLPISAFATPAQHVASGGTAPTVENLLSVFSLIRGMHSVLKSWEDVIERGPLGDLLRLRTSFSETALLGDVTQRLRSLKISRDLDLDVQNTLREGVSSLLCCIEFVTSKAAMLELRVVMMWPIYFSEAFYHLMYRRQYVSMEILKCYVSVLRSAGAGNWYLQDWGDAVSKDIERNCNIS